MLSVTRFHELVSISRCCDGSVEYVPIIWLLFDLAQASDVVMAAKTVLSVVKIRLLERPAVVIVVEQDVSRYSAVVLIDALQPLGRLHTTSEAVHDRR